MIVFLNGKFLDSGKAMVSVNDHGFLYGDGVYETMRTLNGEIWQVAKHLKRLRKSADLLGIKIIWSDAKLIECIKLTIAKNKFKESKIRLTVTRGENGFDFGSPKKPTICIQVTELKKNEFKKGVKIVTLSCERVLPQAKTNSLLPMVLGQRICKAQKAYETIFISKKNKVLEGTITNIFVVKNNILITPKTGILTGTTRELVLKKGRKIFKKVLVKDFSYRVLCKADEVFICNAPRGIIPVAQVDNIKIGNGKIGKFTEQLISTLWLK